MPTEGSDLEAVLAERSEVSPPPSPLLILGKGDAVDVPLTQISLSGSIVFLWHDCGLDEDTARSILLAEVSNRVLAPLNSPPPEGEKSTMTLFSQHSNSKHIKLFNFTLHA